jgi:soluble lytic murein transglycosylase-like protein
LPRHLRLIAAACATCATLAATAHAAETTTGNARDTATVQVLEHPKRTFERSLKLGTLQVRYATLLERAAKHDVKPRKHELDEAVATAAELRRGIERLRERIAEARRAERREARLETSAAGAVAEAGGEVPAQVAPSSTLEAIAACESGGDPSAVNPAGYYGKYQFDVGTWQSVGGTGNPAQASEAEQDYRAQLLYERAGASPWPVCGG